MESQKSYLKKPSLLLKRSPYGWRDGQKLFCENKNLNCTFDEMNGLLEKGLLNLTDMEIVKTLSRYRLLPLSGINECVSRSLEGTGYEKRDYKRNVKKLMDVGIVRRYCFSSVIGNTYSLPDSACSIRFYDLSRGAYSYAKKTGIKGIHHLEEKLTEETALMLLALNQFDIGFLRRYGRVIDYRSYMGKRKVGAVIVQTDLYYRIRSTKDGLSMHVYVTCARANPEFDEKYLEKLRTFHSLIQMDNHYCSSIVLTLCESLEEIKRIFDLVHQEEGLDRDMFLFTTDITDYVFGSFGSIIQCSFEEGNILFHRLQLFDDMDKNNSEKTAQSD